MARKKKTATEAAPATPVSVEPQTSAPPAPLAPVIALRRRDDLSGAPLEMTPEGVALVERLSSEGATRAQVASVLRINRTTLREIMKRQPEVLDAFERGTAADERQFSNLLRDKGLAGDTVAILFYLKARHGWREGTERESSSVQVGVQIIQLPGAAKSDQEFYARFPPPTAEPGSGGEDDSE